ncbi:MAG: hypothetical protein ACI97A_003490 [Planctomycetota bacterium]
MVSIEDLEVNDVPFSARFGQLFGDVIQDWPKFVIDGAWFVGAISAKKQAPLDCSIITRAF